MRIIAIDPGPEESAYVMFDTSKGLIEDKGKVSNDALLARLQGDLGGMTTRCVIEQIASYGMAVGKDIFETCVWTGRFMQAFGPQRCDRIPRLAVKVNLCRSAKANDGNIRQAIIDRFGPGKEKAIGKKSAPGPLFGVAGDIWSALAVAITWTETRA